MRNVAIFTLVVLALASCSRSGQPVSEPGPSAVTPSPRIEYSVYRQWTIPNGGYGRVVVVDPKTRNEADLRLLGATLKADLKDDRNAFVFVFDDPKAAAMQQNVLDLSEPDGLYYDQHFIANYTKNGTTGFHRFDIMVDGATGKVVTVQY